MKRVLLALLLIIGLGVALTAWLGLRSDFGTPGTLSAANPPPPAERLAQGEYLVRLGDCAACHTARGGAPFAGGRAIATDFGVFHAPNITPDDATGLGRWSADDFWRALHEGRGRGGELLYPSFPYTHYTRLTRADSDAMYAYLRAQPAVSQANREHVLGFPYQWRPLLLAWRALYFRPQVMEPDAAQDAQWNRGAYLVEGLAHCEACHAARNALGAPTAHGARGGQVLQWYAPSLHASAEAGVQAWPEADIVALLKTGTSPQASTLGPMAEVVYESLQHAHEADLAAMARYLKSLPDAGVPAGAGRKFVRERVVPASMRRGEKLYAEHCADCHGEQGQGQGSAAIALAGNRALLLESPLNPIRVLLYGAYAPGTAGNPRPYGMPPFSATLNDQQLADLLTYTRGSWGNQARPVADFEVRNARSGPLW